MCKNYNFSWGRTETGQKSNRKLKVAIDGVDLNQCKKVYSAINVNLREGQICAGGTEGQDSCQGLSFIFKSNSLMI